MKTRMKPKRESAFTVLAEPDPDKGLDLADDARAFFDAHPLNSIIGVAHLEDVARELLPHWFKDEDGNDIELNNGEIALRLNAGAANRKFGQTAYRLFYRKDKKYWVVIDGLDWMDQINVAVSIANSLEHALARLKEALSIVNAQIRAELTEEQQEAILSEVDDIEQAKGLLRKWAEDGTRTLGEAVQTMLGAGYSAQLTEGKKK